MFHTPPVPALLLRSAICSLVSVLTVFVVYHLESTVLAKGLFLSNVHCGFLSEIFLNASLINEKAESNPWVEFITTLAFTLVSTSAENSGNNFKFPRKFANRAPATGTDFVTNRWLANSDFV